MPTLNTIANLGRKLAQTDLPKIPRRGWINMSYPTNAAQMALETAARKQEEIKQAYRDYGIEPTTSEVVMYWTPLVWVPFAVGVWVDALSFPASQVRNVYNTAADAINAWISAHNKKAYDRRLEAKSKIVWELGRLRNEGKLFSDLNRTMALIDLYNKVK